MLRCVFVALPIFALALSALAAPATAPATTAASAPKAPPPPAEKIRIACVGDSVTWGDGNPRDKTYPAYLQKSLGENYDVQNFGVNSMAVLKKADFSYFNNKAYKAALDFNPNIVIMQFGGNDSKTQNWPNNKGDFIKDYKELIDSFKALPTKPRIIINTTSPAFVVKWGIDNKIIVGEVIPQIRQTAFNENLEIIDINTALIGKGDMFPDKMHPGPEACAYMAKIVEGVLTYKADAAFNIEKNLTDKGAGKPTNFHGFRKFEFKIDTATVTVVVPHRVAGDHPIAWRANLFGEQPQVDIGLLQRGYHLVHVDSAEARDWDAAHALLKQWGLNGKITLIAFDAGAANACKWAADHSSAVAAIYADSARLPQDLPLQLLAKSRTAIVLVVGEKDGDASISADNVGTVYKNFGGKIEVIRKKDAAAKPYSLPNPEPILNFIYANNAAANR
jgi:lysophospholipase L1-like esterase